MCWLFDGEPRDHAQRRGMPGDEGLDPATPSAGRELAGGERVPQPCAWGGRGAEGTRLVCGSRGSWQGLQGRLLLKSRQKVLGGAGALRGGGHCPLWSWAAVELSAGGTGTLL